MVNTNKQIDVFHFPNIFHSTKATEFSLHFVLRYHSHIEQLNVANDSIEYISVHSAYHLHEDKHHQHNMSSHRQQLSVHNYYHHATYNTHDNSHQRQTIQQPNRQYSMYHERQEPCPILRNHLRFL